MGHFVCFLILFGQQFLSYVNGWVCTSTSCNNTIFDISNVIGTGNQNVDCSDSQCINTIFLCSNAMTGCTINCKTANSCINMTVYSSATSANTINCAQTNACNNVSMKCGNVSPPNQNQTLYKDRTTSQCNFKCGDPANACLSTNLYCAGNIGGCTFTANRASDSQNMTIYCNLPYNTSNTCSGTCGGSSACLYSKLYCNIKSSQCLCNGAYCNDMTIYTINNSLSPTNNPSHFPSDYPTFLPTIIPTLIPSYFPSNYPSNYPSKNPTQYPSKIPSFYPSFQPTYLPNNSPSITPSNNPSNIPSLLPINSPTFNPTFKPTIRPTYKPTYKPTKKPTYNPTQIPTYFPTLIPTRNPTNKTINYALETNTNSNNSGLVILVIVIIILLIFTCLIILLTLSYCYSKHKLLKKYHHNNNNNSNNNEVEPPHTRRIKSQSTTSGENNIDLECCNDNINIMENIINYQNIAPLKSGKQLMNINEEFKKNTLSSNEEDNDDGNEMDGNIDEEIYVLPNDFNDNINMEDQAMSLAMCMGLQNGNNNMMTNYYNNGNEGMKRVVLVPFSVAQEMAKNHLSPLSTNVQYILPFYQHQHQHSYQEPLSSYIVPAQPIVSNNIDPIYSSQ